MATQGSFRQLWSPEEDAKLREIMQSTKNVVWTEIATQFKNRTGKQCRERWVNHLDPEIDEREWTAEEDDRLLSLHNQIGNKWAAIAKCMQGRSENTIKNRWHSSIKKRMLIDPVTGRPVLRDPIARGRAKKLSFDALSSRKPFSSVPLSGFQNPQVNVGLQKVVPNTGFFIFDPHASVPISQNRMPQPIQLMAPDFSPRKTMPPIPLMAQQPFQPIAIPPNPTIIQTPQINPPATTMSVPLHFQAKAVPPPLQTKATTEDLSVQSLMNPNFPPKNHQPTVIRHNQPATVVNKSNQANY